MESITHLFYTVLLATNCIFIQACEKQSDYITRQPLPTLATTTVSAALLPVKARAAVIGFCYGCVKGGIYAARETAQNCNNALSDASSYCSKCINICCCYPLALCPLNIASLSCKTGYAAAKLAQQRAQDCFTGKLRPKNEDDRFTGSYNQQFPLDGIMCSVRIEQ